MTIDAEWTDTDLALLQSLDAADTPLAMIARRLGRSEDALAAKLPEARARPQTLPIPHRDAEGEATGPDEEGEVPPPTGREADDLAAWVHNDPKI
jgi:hypothetical protein